MHANCVLYISELAVYINNKAERRIFPSSHYNVYIAHILKVLPCEQHLCNNQVSINISSGFICYMLVFHFINQFLNIYQAKTSLESNT